MRRARVLAIFAFALGTTLPGCVRRVAAPTTPFGHPVAAMSGPAIAAVSPRALGGRTIVVGPIDSEIVQPIGGAYDRGDYEHSPLARVWFVPEIATLLGDALVDGVLRNGGVGLRETSGVLLASGRSRAMLREGSEQWRVRLVSFEHDLVSEPGAERPYADVAARVVVTRVRGGPTPSAPSEQTIDVHLRVGLGADALAVFADAIIARVVSP